MPTTSTWFYSCNGRDGQLHTSLYDKRDDFNFHVKNSPFLSSHIPSSPAYYALPHIPYGMPGAAPLMNVYSDGGATFILAPWTGICQETFEIVSREVLLSIWGSHQTL